MEDRCRQCARCRRELYVVGKELRTCTEKADIGERILQQCVAGLETFQQSFLFADSCCKPVNWSPIKAFGLCVGTEPCDRILHFLRSGVKAIVVTKQTSPRL